MKTNKRESTQKIRPSTALWVGVYEELKKHNVKFPKGFNGIGAAYAGLVAIDKIIQEEIKNAKEDGYQKGTNYMQDYADQAYRQAREEVIEQTRQGILKDLHQLRWAIDTKPFKVFKEDFIDFVNEIDNLKL